MDIRAMGVSARAAVEQAEKLRREAAEKAALEAELLARGETLPEKPAQPKQDAWTRIQG